MNYILLLGGNIGDKLSFISNAINAIEIQCGELVNQSKIYETEAWGEQDQASFYNQVIVVSSQLTPHILLGTILQIEKDLGRVRFKKWGERVIDIDILFVDSEVIDSKNLIVPHPFIQERRFTLVPLLDVLNKDFIHPKLQKTLVQLYLDCPDQLEVKEVLQSKS